MRAEPYHKHATRLGRLLCGLGLHAWHGFHWCGFSVRKCRRCPLTIFFATQAMPFATWTRVLSVEDIPIVAQRLGAEMWRRLDREACDKLIRQIERTVNDPNTNKQEGDL